VVGQKVSRGEIGVEEQKKDVQGQDSGAGIRGSMCNTSIMLLCPRLACVDKRELFIS